jgi:hypothetical protein
MKKTITITFGDCAENHVGMQIIGTPLKDNSFLDSLQDFYDYYSKENACELYDLNYEEEKAQLLIIRNYTVDLFDDLSVLDWDKKAKMYGRVCNKKARHNLCFADFSQEPNYEESMGRVVDFKDQEYLSLIKDHLEYDLLRITGKTIPLVAEGNYYYSSSCNIGYHGDSERKLVIGCRFGSPMKLLYQWYRGKTAVAEEMEFILNPSDVYVMSSKAIGTDWKTAARFGRLALRHSARF